LRFGQPSNRRFEFNKRGQLFLRSHNETLSVAALGVSDPDRSPALGHVTVEQASEPPEQSPSGKYRAVIPLS
jgi:hypothetical protein